MIAILLGLAAAIGWGTADFVARFTGRALGPVVALFWVMLAGSMLFGGGLLLAGAALPLPWAQSWWSVGNAVAAVFGLLLLYEGLRRGPISTVAPLAGAFPAWSLALLVLFWDVRPPALSWLAMALTMAGIIIVARFAPDAGDGNRADGKVVLISLAAGAMFGASLVLGMQSAQLHGDAQSVWLARVLGTALLLAPALLLARRGHTRLRPPPPRLLGLLLLQGLLDAGGFLALVLAGPTENGALASVISSGFGLITIALARLVLGEPVAARQAIGIALTFAGVALMAAVG